MITSSFGPTKSQKAYINSSGLTISGDLTTSGTITNGATSYIYAGGLRINGNDPNTLYNDNRVLGITALNNINFATGTSMVNYATRMTINTAGRVGISNNAPLSMLHIGNCEVANSAPVIVFGKNVSGTSFRNAFMGYTDTFFFVIGDYGNNNTSNTLTQQLAIHYAAPSLPLIIGSSGNVVMQYGFPGASVERIKTNTKLLRMH